MLLRMAGLLVLGGLMAACAGVPLRPDGLPSPQSCPEGALEAMRGLGIRPGDVTVLVADATQADQRPSRFYEGPVTGINDDRSFAKIPQRSRFFGRVWVGKEKAAIRYHEVQLPDGRRFPFCAQAHEPLGGLARRADSPPGVAIVPDSVVTLVVMDAYVERTLEELWKLKQEEEEEEER